MFAMEAMLARMIGLTPEQMKEKFDGFIATAEKGVAALAVIESNTANMLAKQEEILAGIERIENERNGSDGSAGARPRRGRGTNSGNGDASAK